MDEKRNEGKRGFYHLAESWYGKYRTDMVPGEVVDDVAFGIYSPDGGTLGEMRMEWVELYSSPSAARLTVFDDAFKLLPAFQDVWEALTKLGDCRKRLTPKLFCEMLLAAGFEDLTQRKGPRD